MSPASHRRSCPVYPHASEPGLRRVAENGGAAGADGVTVEGFKAGGGRLLRVVPMTWVTRGAALLMLALAGSSLAAAAA